MQNGEVFGLRWLAHFRSSSGVALETALNDFVEVSFTVGRTGQQPFWPVSVRKDFLFWPISVRKLNKMRRLDDAGNCSCLLYRKDLSLVIVIGHCEEG